MTDSQLVDPVVMEQFCGWSGCLLGLSRGLAASELLQPYSQYEH